MLTGLEPIPCKQLSSLFRLCLATEHLVLGAICPPIQTQLDGNDGWSLRFAIGLPITSLTAASILDNDMVTFLGATDGTFRQSRKRRFVLHLQDESSATCLVAALPHLVHLNF